MKLRIQLSSIVLLTLAFLLMTQSNSVSQSPPPTPLPWDVNNDKIVDVFDLVLVGIEFGQSGENIAGDVNGDGVVDVFDLILVAWHFGEAIAPLNSIGADVTGVATSGSPGAYTFRVTVESPDTGCDQYADWWEVLSEDGDLHYRRTLLHSHVGEQPFTRSGGPVPIAPNMVVIVRAHMNTTGYGGVAFRGSVETGFASTQLPEGFADHIENQDPQPPPCAF